MIVIGASTGGPPALAAILAELPADLNVPVLVVQHMADGFVEALARWLDDTSPMPVVMASACPTAGSRHGARGAGRHEHRAAPRAAGRAAHAAGGAVPRARRRRGVHQRGHHLRRATPVGVLLTGMGRDGAIGLRKMRDLGGLTIGQDEPTSVVWGMPAAAQALGAVERELPLSGIAAAIVERGAQQPRAERPPARRNRRPSAAAPMTAQLSDADFAAVRDYLARTAGLVFDENRRAGPGRRRRGPAARLGSSQRRRATSPRSRGAAGDVERTAAARRRDGPGDPLLPQRPADGGACGRGCCPT